MEIIIAAGIYPPDIGGPATYSQTIAWEFGKRGIEVKVICYSDKDDNDVIRILRKHNVFKRYWLYYKKLKEIAGDADVIYAQGPLSAGLPAMRVSKKLKKKFVIKIVGDYAWEQYQNNAKRKVQNAKLDDIEKFQKNKHDFWTELRRKIQKLVTKSADKVIVPSEFLKKIVLGWGINENKIEVIYNAFSKPEKIKSVELDGDVIISAGRPEPWKGFDVLKKIMPDLLKQNPNFKLIIATKFLHDELMGYFRASKMFVLNSGYEGLPHIILEAMACGLPVIATNVGGNPEVVKHGYNGLLVEYNNKKQLKEAILRLWKDKELQNKFVKNGYKKLEEFKLEDMVNKTLKILKS